MNFAAKRRKTYQPRASRAVAPRALLPQSREAAKESECSPRFEFHPDKACGGRCFSLSLRGCDMHEHEQPALARSAIFSRRFAAWARRPSAATSRLANSLTRWAIVCPLHFSIHIVSDQASP